MEIIVDANILLAGFLKEATTRELLLDARLNLFAPEHLVVEIRSNLANNPKIRKRIRLSSGQLQELFSHLAQRAGFVLCSFMLYNRTKGSPNDSGPNFCYFLRNSHFN